MAREPRARLLVSLHDVSPLTLDACRDAIAVLCDAGVPVSALTLLVVPFHEARVSLDEHPPTLELLHELADQGAALVAHGYTHRMTGQPRAPIAWLVARWFARGEGEFAACSAAEAERRLTLAAAIFARARLDGRLLGFVPPAWLLSRDAAAAVAAQGFAFCERFAGIVRGDHLLARRLVGWGSRTAIEAIATSAWAWLQSRRAPIDTRMAVHPSDVSRGVTRRSLVRTVRALTARLEPVSYATYLAARAEVTLPNDHRHIDRA
jgi:predicted deacetylase